MGHRRLFTYDDPHALQGRSQIAIERFIREKILQLILPHYSRLVLNIVKVVQELSLKPATLLAILYADRGDQRKSLSVYGAAIAITDRRDRRIKSPITDMPDICEFKRRSRRLNSPRSVSKISGLSPA